MCVLCALCSTDHTPGWAPTAWSCWLRAGPSSSAGRPWNQKRRERGHSLKTRNSGLVLSPWPTSARVRLHAGSSWRVMSEGCYFQTVREPRLEPSLHSSCNRLTARLWSETAALVSAYLRLKNSSREWMNQCVLNINASHGGLFSAACTDFLFSC